MSWIVANIKWIMVVSGVLTSTIIYLVFAGKSCAFVGSRYRSPSIGSVAIEYVPTAHQRVRSPADSIR